MYINMEVKASKVRYDESEDSGFARDSCSNNQNRQNVDRL
jgi:hypothetical protein